MTVHYKWIIEELDQQGDIEDVTHQAETLKDLPKHMILESLRYGPSDTIRYRLALVRDDEHSRGYAYMTRGILDSHFDNGHKVPQSYVLSMNIIVQSARSGILDQIL